MTVDVSNFKVISEAHVDIEGITLIRGQNDSGKSSFIQAIRTAVKNESGEDQIKYGTKSFTVKLAVGGRSLSFSRKKNSSPLLAFDGGKPIDKLGRLSISDIDPTFPLKVLTFSLNGTTDTEKFMPNFVFQEQVPVFGQVDIYAFFSAMFEPVAKVSRHLLAVRKRSSGVISEVNAVKAQSDSLLEMQNSIEAQLKEIDEPTVITCEANLAKGRAAWNTVVIARTSLSDIDREVRDLQKYRVLEGIDFQAAEVIYGNAERVLSLLEKQKEKRTRIEQLQCQHHAAKYAEVMLPRVQELASMYDSCLQYSESVSTMEAKKVNFAGIQQRWGQAVVAAESLPRVKELVGFNSSITDLQAALGREKRATVRWTVLASALVFIRDKAEPWAIFAKKWVGFSLVSEAVRGISQLSQDNDFQLQVCRDELSQYMTCPICNSNLETSLDNYVGGHQHG